MDDGLDILVFAAHPDDAEIGMGGTIYKHTSKGDKVAVCDLTYAELSSNGDVKTRQKEAVNAANILGLSGRYNLGLPDRRLEKNAEQIEAVTAVIRRCRPRLVFAPHPKDRHPDHVNCGQLVGEAVFNAKLRNYMPELQAWKVDGLFYYYINGIPEPDLIVDVSGQYEVKRNALRAYKTQFLSDPGDPETEATPLNTGYLERVEARDKLIGQEQSAAYAEGFTCNRPYLIERF